MKRRLSRLGFRGATAGLKSYLHCYDPANDADREPVLATVCLAPKLGVNYFDTAHGYDEGASEQIFGDALEGIAAEDLFIATKVGLWHEGGVHCPLESSLENLRRDYVDLLQIHGTVYRYSARRFCDYRKQLHWLCTFPQD